VSCGLASGHIVQQSYPHQAESQGAMAGITVELRTAQSGGPGQRVGISPLTVEMHK